MTVPPFAPAGTAAGSAAPRRRRIGEVLVEQGLLSPDQLSDLLAKQLDPSRPSRPRLGRLMVETGLATERQVAAALATALGLRMVDLATEIVDPETARLLPKALAERSGVLVLRRENGVLDLAVVDPTNVVALDDVRMRTGARELRLFVVTESQLSDHLSRVWSLAEGAGEVVTLLDAFDDGEPNSEASPDESGLDSAPVVRLVDVLIADAVTQRASDVHVEPGVRETRVRFRVDGLLRDVMTVPRSAHPPLVSRLKILAGLDIAERRKPQDGRAHLGVGGRQVEARMSTLPSMHGEKVVLRLLARAADVQRFEDIVVDPAQREALREAVEAPQGLVLITGPTGSGKTSTLYALLAEVNRPERNIVTLEDPVEITMPGLTQVQIQERAGLTFAKGLRSVLRQDPDMVLVGEVRDAETAELALQASLTGHLVLSTLHTNDAVAALTRLVDMGVEPFLVASSLSLVAAQRLVRRPCQQCAAPYQPQPKTLALLGLTGADLVGATPHRGVGCPRCGGTGYRGRLGVFEVLPVTAAVRAVLLANPTEHAVAAAARASGMVSLRQSALAAAARGDTTYEEVLRVTSGTSSRSSTPRRCRSCDRPAPDDVGEDQVCCPWCGTETEEQGCPACRRKMHSGWSTCPYCRTPLATGHGGRPRILAIDDDASVGAFLRVALIDTAEVDVASSADEGLRVLARGGHDLVVVDLGLPDIPGTELVALLAGDPATASVPVLVLSGTDDWAALHRLVEQGVSTLSKPVSPEVLEATVSRLLNPAKV